MIQFLRQHCTNSASASSNPCAAAAIKRPTSASSVGADATATGSSSSLLGMTPVSASTSAIGSHLAKSVNKQQHGNHENNNLANYFNMNNANNMMLLNGGSQQQHQSAAKMASFNPATASKFMSSINGQMNW